MKKYLWSIATLVALCFLGEISELHGQTEIKATSLSVAVEKQPLQAPATCGGGEYQLSGNIALTCTVSFNASGGMDVKIDSNRRNVTAASLVTPLNGTNSETLNYSNSSVESFSWVHIENVPLQSADGVQKLLLHVQWHYEVNAGGEVTAKIEDISADCGV